MSCRCLALVVCAALSSSLARAAPEPQVTRADLALAYLQLERSLRARPPVDAAELARVNRVFDQATLGFFSGNARGAVSTLRALTVERMGLDPAEAAAARVAANLKARGQPPVWRVGGEPARVRLTRLVSRDGEPARINLRLRLRDETGEIVEELSFAMAGGPPPTLQLSGDLPRGAYTFEVATEAGASFLAGRWAAVQGSLDGLRAAGEARLAEIATRGPRHAEALATCRARLRLLRDTPEEADTARLLSDPARLADQLREELDRLEAGEDPYRGRLGDTWRLLAGKGFELPLRVFAPRAAAAGRPLPLLVACHGAGGDENMFAYGYGSGRLLELAESEGFLVATPRTEVLLRAPGAFSALLAALEDDYSVDRGRVYLLGHSLGTMTVQRLLASEGEGIAAAVGFAGRLRSERVPTLAFAGAIDPLGAMARLGGKGANLRVLENYGHTLMVGDYLDEAVAWLLARSRWF